ncbi:MAG TPA: thymidylate synthase [Methanomicrobiales archaeon]|nr:thymidylate synthase [Methanomicrobiales archaeon]
MRIIRAPNLGRAHELAVKTVLEKGWVLETEDGEATVECDEIGIRVEEPFAAPMASPRSRFQQRFLEKYADDLIHGTPAEFEYDYHGRLFDWGEGLSSAGRELHVDQVAYMIRKLATQKVSRRAIAITWIPPIDEKLDDCPCLQLVQCLVRDGVLRMKVVFRSNDMLSAAGANMFALAHLEKYVADALGLPCGPYTHISLVPHIYYKRDMTDLQAFCRDGADIQPVEAVCGACGRCAGRGHR